MASNVRHLAARCIGISSLWTVLLIGSLASSNALAADQIVYNYDALGRLQSVTYPGAATVSYTYDPAGNRTQVTNSGGGPTGSTQTPQQRRKAALIAVLSILLGN
jgi:YD repeat-containing protein